MTSITSYYDTVSGDELTRLRDGLEGVMGLSAADIRLAAEEDRRNRAKVTIPQEMPFVGVSQRANSTAVSYWNPVAIGSRVYWVIKAGTTGASPPTASKSNLITDGTAILAYAGYLAPVAYANSLALYDDQLFAANGRIYRAVAAGTTAAGPSTGPSSATGGTDGTVTYEYVGEQTLPLITDTTTAVAGTTARENWDSAKITKLGGTYIKDPSNPRGALVSSSAFGTAYTATSGGGGTYAFVSDGEHWSFAYSNRMQSFVIIDGQVAALVFTGVAGLHHLTFDCRGLLRRPREIKIMADSQSQFFACYATAADTFAPYVPKNPRKAVLIGDSFAGYWPWGYSNRLGLMLGYEEFRIASVGGTGILQPNGSTVNYRDRFTVDVINHAPDDIIIQCTLNDTNGIPGSFSNADVKNALRALIQRCRDELPNSRVILMTTWNNRGALSAGAAATLYADEVALAAEMGVPLIDWTGFNTDGGYAGAPSGSGNSLFYTSGDGVHPSWDGAVMRATRLVPMFEQVLRYGA